MMTKTELETLAAQTFGWCSETYQNWRHINSRFLQGRTPISLPNDYQDLLTEFALRKLSKKLEEEQRFFDLQAQLIEHGLFCPECGEIDLVAIAEPNNSSPH